MRLGDLIGIHDRSFPVYPRLLNWLGINETLFISRITWWSQDGDEVSKTCEEIRRETGLSEKQQRSARSSLVERGILQERNDRLSHQMFYRVVPESLVKEVPEFSAETDTGSTCQKVSSGTAQLEGEHLPKGQFGNGQKVSSTINGKDLGKDGNKEEPSPVTVLKNGWCERYEKKFGVKYHFEGAKDATAVTRVLSRNIPVDQFLDTADDAWNAPNDRDHWHCRNSSGTIAKFVAAFNDIMREITLPPMLAFGQKPRGNTPDHSKGF